MTKYVVEAYDTRKGYRATISIPLTKGRAQKLAKELKYQNSIVANKFYNKLTNIKIKPIGMATKKKKSSAKKKKSSISTCASALGRRGGKKTYSLGHGIFASITIKKKKRSAAKKRKAVKKRKK